jgi:hypothetical protein
VRRRRRERTDAGPDAAIDSCDDCASGETCVQWFDGVCIGGRVQWT